MSAGELSAGKLSAGELSAGELSAGELSAGELSEGELSEGELSCNPSIEPPDADGRQPLGKPIFFPVCLKKIHREILS